MRIGRGNSTRRCSSRRCSNAKRWWKAQGGRKKFRFKNKLMSLDGSIIDLSVSMFDWAKFRRTKGAIKLHLLLDHDGYLPSFVVVTEGKTQRDQGGAHAAVRAGHDPGH